MLKSLTTFAILAGTFIAGATQAQSTPPPVAPSPALASSPAKAELVQRVLKLQQGGIERLAGAMAEEPAMVMIGRASEIISAGVPKDKQEALAKDIRADLQKYLKDTAPTLTRTASALAPLTVGPILEANFSEEELRELVAMLESPTYNKYQKLSGDMQRALQSRLVSDSRSTVELRLRALDKSLGDRLKIAIQPTTASSKPPAK